MRKNSRARKWVPKRIKELRQEGYSQSQALLAALEEAMGHRLLKNPAEVQELRDELDGATEVAEGFHGRRSRDEFEEVKEEQYRSELAVLGDLEELEVFNPFVWDASEEMKTLTFSRKKKDLVKLAGSGDRKQLFLVGGDTQLEESFLEEVSPKGYKRDKVSVGFVYSISYWADKHHLEGSSGKHEAYMHCFGESSFENPNARQDGMADYQIWALKEKLEAGCLPELIYDRLNETLELVGGGYEIRDEGIWD